MRKAISGYYIRFTSKVKIELTISDFPPSSKIPPLLFTSYLENAFKHGISYQEESYIKTYINTNNSHLIFRIENSNPKIKLADSASGIGMTNTKKRLDILYNSSYKLKITNTKDIFIVDLTIPI